MINSTSVKGMDFIEFKNSHPDGFYGKDIENKNNKNGIWNSIKWKGNKMFRVRSEVLILKGDMVFIAPGNKYYKYTLPGGSTEQDIGIVETAIKECREEARINIKNVMCINSYEDNRKHIWSMTLNEDPNINLHYDGNITYVCVGEYDSKYTGEVDLSDIDEHVMRGKFVQLDKTNLRGIHREAITKYLNKE